MNSRLVVRPETAVDSAPKKRTTLIYLAGAPHSGSTILESILTASPEVQGLGQFGRFYAYRDFSNCSCGKPSASCTPCAAVISDVVEPFGVAKYRRIGRLTRREWGLPLLAVSGRLRRLYREPSEAAFTVASATAGTTVLLDSSKSISRGLSLIDTHNFDVVVVHTVRDFAGYIASREKRTQKHGRARDVLRLWKWLVKNVLVVRVLQPRSASFLTVRFEDLAADPELEIKRLCDEIGVDPTDAIERLAAGEQLERTHLFEPPRQFDYRGVVFDPNRRNASAKIDDRRRKMLWKLGGSFGAHWGYNATAIDHHTNQPRKEVSS